jgi:hypothetical protein
MRKSTTMSSLFSGLSSNNDAAVSSSLLNSTKYVDLLLAARRSDSDTATTRTVYRRVLYSYYQQLSRYKFALSPSSPQQLTHCEWEALAAGT